MKAYSYVRFSAQQQLRGDSVRRQSALSAAYCERNGLTLDTSLRLQDLGVSAFRGTNAVEGALAGFREAIRSGKVQSGSTLIVESLDRLSRDQVGSALTIFLEILNSGVSIVTMNPERVYTKSSINDIAGILEPIIIMARSHEESAMKASRLSAAWSQKRAGKKKLTARIPAWLNVNEDYSGFILKEESVELVRQIFLWANHGQGINTITRKLNQDGVVNFGNRSKTGWHRTYVLKILRSRAVIGEFQPHTGSHGKRKPVGQPIPDYYPRIISDNDFYSVQKALDGRKFAVGPRGKNQANLFTGLVRDARDRMPMNLVDKGTKCLVSSGAARGVLGSVYMAFPYETFEKAFLRGVRELKYSDLFQGEKVSQIPALEGKISNLDVKIGKIKARMEKEDSIDALMEMAIKFEKEKKGLVAELEKEKTASHNDQEKDFAETKTLMELMLTDNSEDLRTKVKGKIAALVKEIWVAVWEARGYFPEPHDRGRNFRFAMAQVVFNSGQSRFILAEKRTGANMSPDETTDVIRPDLDLSKGCPWIDQDATRMPKALGLAMLRVYGLEVSPEPFAAV